MNWFARLSAALTKWLDEAAKRRAVRQHQKHRRWLRRNNVVMPRSDGAHLPKPDYRRWSDQYMDSIRSRR
jgi:hypothetical protein